MELVIAELARYITVLLFAVYAFYSFRAFSGKMTEGKDGVFRVQRILTVMIHFVCSVVLIVEQKDLKYVALWALELVFYLGFVKIYQIFIRGCPN